MFKAEDDLIEAVNICGEDGFGDWTTEQLGALFDIPGQLLLQDSNQDMIAINRFMSDTFAATPEAVRLKDQWIRWWDKLTWNERNLSSSVFDEARNRRNAFMIANAKNPKQTQEIISRGIETEEMEGGSRRTTDDGFFPNAPSEDEAPPLIPSWVKIGAGVAVLGGVALGVMKIIGSLNPAALAMRFSRSS
jgi:hypothetical protein